MNSFGTANSKTVNPLTALSRMGWLDETGYEKETPLASLPAAAIQAGGAIVKGAVTATFEAALGLGQTVVLKTESNGKSKFTLDGFIEFTRPLNSAPAKDQDQLAPPSAGMEKLQKEKTEADRKRLFYQALREDAERTRRAKDRLWEEDTTDKDFANLPIGQKNILLHYQASYQGRSIYQRAELRKKLIEEKRKAEKQEKEAAIPSPAKQPSALEGAFEGRSGQQGSGMANLSAHATG